MQMYFQTQDENRTYFSNGVVKCSVKFDLRNNLKPVETLERLKQLQGFESDLNIASGLNNCNLYFDGTATKSIYGLPTFYHNSNTTPFGALERLKVLQGFEIN